MGKNSRKRVRYQWFRNIPRNVTRREYQAYQLRRFGAIGLGVTAAMLAFAALTGITLAPARQLAQVQELSVAEALKLENDSDLAKLEGFLVAADAPTMPDDAARQVIRGQLELSVRMETDSQELPTETLISWEATATEIFLSDGERQIPVGFNPAVLPMATAEAPIEPRIIRRGDSTRNRSPEAVEYGEQVFPLAAANGEELDSVFVDLERLVLPHGESVVVVAGVDASPTGNQLVDPLGDRLQVRMGTEQEIRQEGQQLRWLFGVLWIPMGIVSWQLGQSAQRLWREFVRRSNQP